MRVPGLGGPLAVLACVPAALEAEGLEVLAFAPIIGSAPVGPSQRRYANSAAVIATPLGPHDLLAVLHRIERAFGRNASQRRGQRWRARALDLDVILWSGGVWSSPSLTIPHPLFRMRDFVLRPAVHIARNWRDPLSGLTLGQLEARLRKRKGAQPDHG